MANKKEIDVKSAKTSKKTTPKKTSAQTSAVKKTPKSKVIETMEDPMADIMEEHNNETGVSLDTLKLIGNIVFWLIFIVLAFVWLVDYFRVSRESDPIFCISEKEISYDDGTVKECVGLGYKVYTYDRESLGNGVEFGSFFTKMREPENN